MDPTKNAIKSQTKKQNQNQIPEKSKEQIEQERYMKAPPSREEVMNYIENAYGQLTNSFNIVFSVLQKTLVDKGLVTIEELEKAGEEAVKHLKKDMTNEPVAESESTKETKPSEV